MISDYCKMEWEEFSKSAKRKPEEKALKILSSVLRRLRTWEKPRARKKTRTGFVFGRAHTKVGRAICCLNGVANVTQATDELNISLIWAWQLLCLIPLLWWLPAQNHRGPQRLVTICCHSSLACLVWPRCFIVLTGRVKAVTLSSGWKPISVRHFFFFFFCTLGPRCTYKVILLIDD